MIDALRNRFAHRTDSEHEQALVRLAIVFVVTLYFLPDAIATRSSGWYGDSNHFISLVVLLANAIAILALIAITPAVSRVRRLYGALSDIGAVTHFLFISDEKGLPLILFYVWITIGNGFRFGPRYLMFSLMLTTFGFGFLLTVDSWWSDRMGIGVAFAAGIGILSAYVLTLVRKLFDAVKRAEDANLAKRRFVSNISHEMRTPLNAVINLSRLLSHSELNRDQRDLLDTISSASNVLMQLINDVLDFSKIEAGKLQIERIPFDLHAFINGTFRLFKAQAEAKGLRIHAAMMPEVPHALIGDPHHLRQVLINLIGNALKITQSGSVSLDVSVLTEEADNVRLRFAVRDTGIGMSEDAIAKVFQSFSQADASTSRKFGGTGLGTTIAKQLIDLMKGRIGVESIEGKGTTFWFELQFEKSAVDVPATPSRPEQGAVVLAGLPEKTNADLIGSLSGSTWHIEHAGNIDEAMRRTERHTGPEVKCVIAYAADNTEAQTHAAAYYRQTSRGRPPLVLCIDKVSASGRSVCRSVGYASIIEEPAAAKLVLNAIRSVTAIEASVTDADRAANACVGESDRLKILVVDDAAINLKVAKAILERAGHSAKCVLSGDEALDLLEREQCNYDLILLDLHMPGMDGTTATRSIRYLMRGAEKRIPIIILTADVTPEAREEVLGAGADAILGKPVNPSELHEAIAKFCSHPASGTDAPAQRPRASGTSSSGRPGTPTAATDVPSQIEQSLDLTALGALQGLSTDSGFLDRLVQRYIAEVERRLASCRAAIRDGDTTGLRQALREINAISVSVGATRMSATCTFLCEHVDESIRSSAQKIAEDLDACFRETRMRLERYVVEQHQLTQDISDS